MQLMKTRMHACQTFGVMHACRCMIICFASMRIQASPLVKLYIRVFCGLCVRVLIIIQAYIMCYIFVII